MPDAAFLHHLADLADAQTMPRYRTELATRSKTTDGDWFDPVTEADHLAEFAMRAAIAERFPDHAVWGEELGVTGSGSYRWVLDPIDGTRPFICGLPVWGTLIGLAENGRAILGMMSQPFTGERFWADGGGAYMERDGVRVRLATRQTVSLSEAILHTTSPLQAGDPCSSGFERLRKSVRMTRFGGECYAIAMLAAGRIDLAFEPSLQPHDIVALIPIIEQAGGIVTSLAGGRAEPGGAVLVAATPALHEQAMALLQ